MPALVNISVGSLRGTSGDDDTISWPLAAKKSRNFDLISLTPLMFIQSKNGGPSGGDQPLTLRRNAFRQGGLHCPETVQADYQADHRVAAAHTLGGTSR